MKISTKPHLILFVDLNGTIMLADPVSEKDIEAAINQLLAKKYISVWGEHCSDEISYHDYMENYLCKGDREDLNIKKSRMNFYRNFIPYLQETKHHLLDEIHEEYRKLSEIYANNNGKIIPSFISLINFLDQENISYSVVLRTFGNDLNDVIHELENKTSLTFTTILSINEDGHMQVANKTLKTPEEMLEAFKPGQHYACQDNYSRWKSAMHAHAGGKPFPLCDERITVFLDDHSIDKQILNVICVNKLATYNIEQAALQKELIRLGRIVPVDTYSASLDPNYFIDKVKYVFKTPLNVLL